MVQKAVQTWSKNKAEKMMRKNIFRDLFWGGPAECASAGGGFRMGQKHPRAGKFGPRALGKSWARAGLGKALGTGNLARHPCKQGRRIAAAHSARPTWESWDGWHVGKCEVNQKTERRKGSQEKTGRREGQREHFQRYLLALFLGYRDPRAVFLAPLGVRGGPWAPFWIIRGSLGPYFWIIWELGCPRWAPTASEESPRASKGGILVHSGAISGPKTGQNGSQNSCRIKI